VKTYKNLYPQICAWETLEAAYRKARRGKRAKQPVADFEYGWESNLLRLQGELVTKTYPMSLS
jgi:RNA-directed DNA polymerase